MTITVSSAQAPSPSPAVGTPRSGVSSLHSSDGAPATQKSHRTAKAGRGPSPKGLSFAEVLKNTAKEMSRGDAIVGRAMRLGKTRTAEPHDLLAVQAQLYRHVQEVEMASKLVDKATSGLRQVLQSQQ